MKAVYFPYTYLSPSVTHSLRALFPSVAVYQPVADRLPDEMRPLAEEGFLEVMAPPPGDEEDFDRLIREFQQWSNLHQGGAGLKTAVLHGRPISGPTSGDGTPAEIVSEIRRRLAPEPAANDSDTTLTARVFLHLAQTVDQLGQQIGRVIARHEKAHARLFDALKGQTDPAPAESGTWGRVDRDDGGDGRLSLRMTAWARLFSSHPYPSPVFVTRGQAVIRHLAEKVPGRLKLGLAGLSPARSSLAIEKQQPASDLMSQLVALADAPLSLSDLPNDGGEEKDVGDCAEELCVHLWPQISPCRLFGRTLALGATESNLPQPQFTWRNTLVVQVH
jgi:hypothetical protein